MIKNPPAMLETWVRSLGWEDPLEKGMATHSSILAQRIPMDRGASGLQSMGSQILHVTSGACPAPLTCTGCHCQVLPGLGDTEVNRTSLPCRKHSSIMMVSRMVS